MAAASSSSTSRVASTLEVWRSNWGARGDQNATFPLRVEEVAANTAIPYATVSRIIKTEFQKDAHFIILQESPRVQRMLISLPCLRDLCKFLWSSTDVPSRRSSILSVSDLVCTHLAGTTEGELAEGSTVATLRSKWRSSTLPFPIDLDDLLSVTVRDRQKTMSRLRKTLPSGMYHSCRESVNARETDPSHARTKFWLTPMGALTFYRTFIGPDVHVIDTLRLMVKGTIGIMTEQLAASIVASDDFVDKPDLLESFMSLFTAICTQV